MLTTRPAGGADPPARPAALLDWLEDAPPDRGIRFAVGDDWSYVGYAQLADATRQVAAGLISGGVEPGDVVTIVARSGPDFVATLFGALLAGGVPSPIAPPLPFGDAETYRERVVGLLRTARPRLVVTDPELVGTVRELAAAPPPGAPPSPPPVWTPDTLRAAGTGRPPRFPAPAPDALALLQFTSGSSGRARGVRVPVAALESSVAAIRRWLRMEPGDATASWLPVHHDMGLVGCLITPVVNRSDIWLLPPEEFIRRPVRYLRCFGESGAVLTAMPSFGLEYVARRVRPEALAGLDFSRWRAVIVGAERVDPGALDRFTGLLAPFGFRRTALLPAYGLAEATLPVTGLPLTEEWVAQPAADAPGGTPTVGCGPPVDGMSVTIEDENGSPVPDGCPGEIVVRGTAVAAGYAGGDGAASPSRTSFDGRALRTGDAGFVRNGQLFVLGRLGDSVKVRGRAVFAEDLEAALVGLGLPAHRVAAALGLQDGVPTVVAVVEQPAADLPASAAEVLRRRGEGARIVLSCVPRGTIQRTTSGKPRRPQLWQSFLSGVLPGAEVPHPTRRA
jgi:acyl-CoA synthetase (AMP-forming)/AMP-acid ligase II